MTKKSFTPHPRASQALYRVAVATDDERNAGLRGLSVLVVEDDAAIGTQLVRGLERIGCQPELVTSGQGALDARRADVVLLDLGLPDIDGVEVCRRLRERSGVPVIAVTARNPEGDRVQALDAGADDYIVKPFGFDELAARMRAVLRRSRPGGSTIRYGVLEVDVAGRRVRVDGTPIALTGKEFDILACLALEPGRVVSREEIFDHVWDEHWYGPTKVLDVHVAALRRKLGEQPLIETVYGRGFRLSEPADAS
jgi:DNA-binding response OmpR family regulator